MQSNHSQKKPPIKPEIAILILNQYLKQTRQWVFTESNKRNLSNEKNYYDTTLETINSLKETDPLLYHMSATLINFEMYTLTQPPYAIHINPYLDESLTCLNNLMKVIAKANTETLQKYLSWYNYIFLAISLLIPSLITSYLNTPRAGVTELNFLHDMRVTIEILIEARGGKDDLVAKTAEIMLSSLYYIYPFASQEATFLSRQKSSKKQYSSKNRKIQPQILKTDLTEFLNKEVFEKKYNNFFEIYSKKPIITDEDKCMMYWYEFYLINVSASHEAILRAKSGKEVDVSLPEISALESDCVKVSEFLQSLEASTKSESFYLVPGIDMGANLSIYLKRQIKYAINIDEQRIGETLAQINIKTVLPDYTHAHWNTLHLFLQLKAILLNFKSQIISLASPHDAPMNDPGDILNEILRLPEDKVRGLLKKISTRVFFMSSEVLMNLPIDVVHQAFIGLLSKPAKVLETIWVEYVLRETFKIIALMDAIIEIRLKDHESMLKQLKNRVPNAKSPKNRNHPLRSCHSEPEKIESKKPRNKTKTQENIEERLVELIDKKQHLKAFKLADELRKKAESEQNKAMLAKSYNYLGDIYKSVSNYQQGALKKNNFHKAKKNYLACIHIIDEMNNADKNLLEVKECLLWILEKEFNYKVVSIEKLINEVECKPAESIQEVESTSPMESLSPIEGQSESDDEKIIPSINVKMHFPDYVLEELKILSDYETYLVGGCVRDYPAEPRDFDVATTASMEVIAKLFAGRGRMVGNKFPVYLISVEGRKDIQISRLSSKIDFTRHELVYLENGSLVAINPTDDIFEDAAKRDLTCNALYYDWKNEKLLDPCNGMNDKNNKTIRFICNPSEKLSQAPEYIFKKLFHLMVHKGFSLENELDLTENLHFIKHLDAAELNSEICNVLLDYDCLKPTLMVFEKYHLLKCIYNLSDDQEKILIEKLGHALTNPVFYDWRSRYLMLSVLLAEASGAFNDKVENNLEFFSSILEGLGIYQAESEISKVLLLYCSKIGKLKSWDKQNIFTKYDHGLANTLANLERKFNSEIKQSGLLLVHSMFPSHTSDRSINTQAQTQGKQCSRK